MTEPLLIVGSFVSADTCSNVSGSACVVGVCGPFGVNVGAFIKNNTVSIKSVTKLYKETERNNVQMAKRTKGKWVSLTEYEEIEYHQINENRFGVGREHREKEAQIYAQVGEGEPIKCKEFLLFPSAYDELQKATGEDKTIYIKENGTFWVQDKYKSCKLRVFVKKEIKK